MTVVAVVMMRVLCAETKVVDLIREMIRVNVQRHLQTNFGAQFYSNEAGKNLPGRLLSDG